MNMEACFSQLTLDIIGKAVFNYDFDSLNRDSPLIQAVYTSLKETEQRATDLLPLWKVSTAGKKYYEIRKSYHNNRCRLHQMAGCNSAWHLFGGWTAPCVWCTPGLPCDTGTLLPKASMPTAAAQHTHHSASFILFPEHAMPGPSGQVQSVIQ